MYFLGGETKGGVKRGRDFFFERGGERYKRRTCFVVSKGGREQKQGQKRGLLRKCVDQSHKLEPNDPLWAPRLIPTPANDRWIRRRRIQAARQQFKNHSASA